MSCRAPLILAVLTASVAVAPIARAVAQSPAAAGTISAIGTASVAPTPVDRNSDASIAKAVRDAQAKALPLAIQAGRARAQTLATQSGLGLGALVGIADQPPSPFGGFGAFGIDGTFGPGRYCGVVPRFRRTRLADGRVRRTRIGSRRQCRFPGRVGTTVSVTYATLNPAPAVR